MMNEDDSIQALQAKLRAQQKTIDILMNTVEQKYADGSVSLDLFSQNLSLELVVQRKTELLREQGEDLRRALRELQLTQAQLLHANKLESVGQLAAGIAHEINTPAQFIGSNLDFLYESFTDLTQLFAPIIEQAVSFSKETSPHDINMVLTGLVSDVDWEYLKDEIPTAIRQSQDGVKRITTIVQALKEFSHPSNNEKEMCDLHKLIETTIIVASNEWKYFADIHTEFDPDLPKVLCLADELCQVFLTLLTNAAHAIETKFDNRPQSEKGRIIFSTHHDLQHVEIQISDTGTGIPDNIHSRIFDPFFTTKKVGKGTGQGLAIAHDIITRKHNGSITFTSEVGKGTVFTIRLPITTAIPENLD